MMRALVVDEAIAHSLPEFLSLKGTASKGPRLA